MDLEHINVRAQPLNAFINRIQDVLPAQPHAVRPLAIIRDTPDGCSAALTVVINAKVTFTKDHDLVSWDVILLQRLADDLLRRAVGVRVCRVPGPETDVVGVLE
jgi:hypothetical protein